jgi:hypothetical protein
LVIEHIDKNWSYLEFEKSTVERRKKSGSTKYRVE